MKSKFCRAAVRSLHKLVALRSSQSCVSFAPSSKPCIPSSSLHASLCPLGLNVYDIRIPCEVPGLCYDFSRVETFLQNPEVSCSDRWLDCKRSVGS
jgi:hypothetical protein